MNDLKVSASIMCGNPMKFGWELDKLEKAGADLIHFDMMDGHYVENIAMGIYMLEQMKKRTSIPFDVHLAMFNPEKHIEKIASILDENDCIHVHPESTIHIHRVLRDIKRMGVKAGVAINPATNEDCLEYLIDDIDMVLAMTVSPGFAGQKFIKQTLGKIENIRKMADERNPKLMIAVDGNINAETIPGCVKAGADVLVAGTSSIFKGDDADYKELIQKMKDSVK
ncbi:ribulose-phosphate 3-epimerase [Anaerofustis stercorihominis]|uniref:ribulose-phosphate 3-epimerase n=1 Tax=Anaerofustis stercorihominis TaxID=214853 RepID=UPI00214BFDBD|nr:ribulose-phosphate 3-epimerase [Anaerofustis stercorihominis]MCR2032034.1 ribulose-phosphate 3-epimerase [Anaerofustis stercorihominis]